MKTVSLLTRQAMNRHRILSANAQHLPASFPIPKSVSEESAPPFSEQIVSPISSPPSSSLHVHALYDRTITPPPVPPAVRPSSIHSAPPAPPQPRTIYQQLMTRHDRMTERHLNRT